MMTGEGASHAWTEVWDGQFWHGLDPTHNRLVDERYIAEPWPGFYGCCCGPGCFLGTASQQQTILIKVEEKWKHDATIKTVTEVGLAVDETLRILKHAGLSRNTKPDRKSGSVW